MPRLSEDWLAAVVGGLLLVVCLGAVLVAGGEANPLQPYLAAPAKWVDTPLGALGLGVAGVAVTTLFVFSAAVAFGFGESLARFVPAFAAVFALATLAYVVARQETIAYYGFGYMLWAIVLGLLVANTVGAPKWLEPGLRAELYTKVGLVLLGAEVLLGRLVALGLPGVCVAWIVTPVVLCSTFWFGTRVLRIASPTLVMVVAADMSVCGVSAAIATAAACRAKKEELSIAIGVSLVFTAVMMIVMPAMIGVLGIDPTVGGAWIGGTIDSTGAVAAAGAALGDEGLQAAATIKMIQNILIGVVAFGVATYWVTVVEGSPASGVGSQEEPRSASVAPKPEDRSPKPHGPAVEEIWRRFPKFILGFLGASIVFSLLTACYPDGEVIAETTIRGATKTLRNWCFAIAFTAIGLQTNFRQLLGAMGGAKPIALYATGQSLNLGLTLAMAWLMFGLLFPPHGGRPQASGLRPQERRSSTGAALEPEARGSAPSTELRYDRSALFYTDHPLAWGDRADSDDRVGPVR